MAKLFWMVAVPAAILALSESRVVQEVIHAEEPAVVEEIDIYQTGPTAVEHVDIYETGPTVEHVDIVEKPAVEHIDIVKTAPPPSTKVVEETVYTTPTHHVGHHHGHHGHHGHLVHGHKSVPVVHHHQPATGVVIKEEVHQPNPVRVVQGTEIVEEKVKFAPAEEDD